MTRLIDADALIEKLEKELEVEPRKSIQSSLIKSVCLLFCKVIELEPTVDLRKVTQDYASDTTGDAEPVRHGKWIETDERDVFSGRLYRCSNCKTFVIGNVDNYCSYCGARMDEDD